jgi:hypothetical protein
VTLLVVTEALVAAVLLTTTVEFAAEVLLTATVEFAAAVTVELLAVVELVVSVVSPTSYLKAFKSLLPPDGASG